MPSENARLMAVSSLLISPLLEHFLKDEIPALRTWIQVERTDSAGNPTRTRRHTKDSVDALEAEVSQRKFQLTELAREPKTDKEMAQEVAAIRARPHPQLKDVLIDEHGKEMAA
jgi:hypothetical protein